MSDRETIEGAEDVVTELLALPPQEFTRARNDAVKRLRAEGRRAAADAVKALPRPPLSLWALNRLARDDASPIDAFLAAAGKLLEAHRSGGDIRAATAPERAAEARVVSVASDVVRGQGAKMTAAVTSRLRETLRAAAADAAIAAALRSGRLMREPTAPSLEEILASLPERLPATRSRPAKAETAEERPARPREDRRPALREALKSARKQASDARSEARAAAAAAGAARRELRRAEALAERTQGQAEAAEERVRTLEEQLAAP
jgi:hypothetical protein